VLLPVLTFSWYAVSLYCAPAPADAPYAVSSAAGVNLLSSRLAAGLLRALGVPLPVSLSLDGSEAGIPRPWCVEGCSASATAGYGASNGVCWPSLLPGIYGFVQREYWGVGPGRYYQAKNIPQFVLAAPMIALTCACAAWYASGGGPAVRTKRLWRMLVEATSLAGSLLQPLLPFPAQEWLFAANAPASGETHLHEAVNGPPLVTAACPGTREDLGDAAAGKAHIALPRPASARHRGSRSGFGAGSTHNEAKEVEQRMVLEGTAADLASTAILLDPRVSLPFVCHWLALVAVGLLVMHVQVVTRFVCACPALYWYMAALWLRGGGESASSFGPSASSWLQSILWLLPGVRVLLLAYCVGYTLTGTLLFTNFYNWT